MLYMKSLAMAAAVVVAGAAQAQGAVVESIAFFKSTTVDNNYEPFQPGNLVLFDDFLNGNPALSDLGTSGQTFGYGFPNALPGVQPVEAGGKLSIYADASTSSPTNNAQGTPFYSLAARLLTNTNATATVANGKLQGLGKDSTWSIGANFAPLVPPVGASYMIRLSDGGIGASGSQLNDVLQLQVAGTNGGPQVRLVQQNFIAGTLNVLWSEDIAIPVGADEVRLAFAHLNAGSGLINAYWSIFDGNNSVAGGAIATTGTIFSDEVLTRFEVRAATPVPEPGTYALMLAGMGALALLARRRGRSRG